MAKRDSNPGSSAPEADALTTRPARRYEEERRQLDGMLTYRVTSSERQTVAVPVMISKT